MPLPFGTKPLKRNQGSGINLLANDEGFRVWDLYTQRHGGVDILFFPLPPPVAS